MNTSPPPPTQTPVISIIPAAPNTQNEYIVYPYRWVILFLFSITSFNNASLWTSFAPVSTSSSYYFKQNSAVINILALMYQILYLPGSMLSSYLPFTTKYNTLRAPVLIGACLTAIGALIRLAVYFTSKTPAFSIVLIGQSLCALSQPLFMNSPGYLAAAWFGTSDRDMATTIASLAAVLGNAYGQILPPMIVKPTTIDGVIVDVDGVEMLMLIQFISSSIILVLVACFFQATPLTPPSASAQERDNLRMFYEHKPSADSVDDDIDTLESLLLSSSLLLHPPPPPSPFRKVLDQAIPLFQDKNFLILLFSFSLGLGLFNSILTLLNNILEPCGYNEDQSSIYAALLLVFGIIGAGISGVVMDKTHAYRPLLKIMFVSSASVVLVLVLNLKPDNGGSLYIVFALLGFFMIPLLPLIIENSIEATFPTNEELSTGILFSSGNIMGLPITFLMQWLLDRKGSDVCGGLFSGVNVTVVCFFSVSAVCILFYKSEYKRLEFERRQAALVVTVTETIDVVEVEE